MRNTWETSSKKALRPRIRAPPESQKIDEFTAHKRLSGIITIHKFQNRFYHSNETGDSEQEELDENICVVSIRLSEVR